MFEENDVDIVLLKHIEDVRIVPAKDLIQASMVRSTPRWMAAPFLESRRQRERAHVFVPEHDYAERELCDIAGNRDLVEMDSCSEIHGSLLRVFKSDLSGE